MVIFGEKSCISLVGRSLERSQSSPSIVQTIDQVVVQVLSKQKQLLKFCTLTQ